MEDVYNSLSITILLNHLAQYHTNIKLYSIDRGHSKNCLTLLGSDTVSCGCPLYPEALAKARGVRLGNPNLHIDNTVRIQQADAFAHNLGPTIQAYLNNGLTHRQIVEKLIKTGVKTPRSGK